MSICPPYPRGQFIPASIPIKLTSENLMYFLKFILFMGLMPACSLAAGTTFFLPCLIMLYGKSKNVKKTPPKLLQYKGFSLQKKWLLCVSLYHLSDKSQTRQHFICFILE